MLLVMPPLGGDDLQMIKRGIMEVSGVIMGRECVCVHCVCVVFWLWGKRA